jgi:hypothetical protein
MTWESLFGNSFCTHRSAIRANADATSGVRAALEPFMESEFMAGSARSSSQQAGRVKNAEKITAIIIAPETILK